VALVDTAFATDRGRRLPLLANYLALVWSNLAVILLTTLIGSGAGYYRASQVPAEFRASASIELPDVPTWVDTQPVDPVPDRTTIDTTAQLVLSTPVFKRVAAETSLTVGQVNSQLSVSAYPLSRVLIVTFEASTADLAIRGADGAAQALIDQRATVLAGAQFGRADTLYARLSHIRNRVARSVAKFSPVSRRITLVLDQINAMRLASVDYNGRIVDDASPATKVNEHPEVQIVTGVTLGLLAGLVFAWWRPSRRNRSG
jgi:hypothetical protein